MPLIRIHARQGHAVPKGYTAQRGPFPPELYARNPRANEEFPKGDSLHEAYDDVRYFRCRDCNEVLIEHELEDHICEEEE